MENTVEYIPITSSVNPSFWSKLTEMKLDVYKSKEIEQHLFGYTDILKQLNCPWTFLEVDSTSFNVNYSAGINLRFCGRLINTNTIERFKDYDKMHLIHEVGTDLHEKIKDGRALEDPSLLNCFILLTFADIKKYQYYYWFAFPVPKGISIKKNKCYPISSEFSDSVVDNLYRQYTQLNERQKGYFLVIKNKDDIVVHSLKSKLSTLPLKESQVYFGFNNNVCSGNVASQLRNYVLLLLHFCPFLENQEASFLALKLTRERTIVLRHSTIYSLTLPKLDPTMSTTWVGWEKNEKDKMGPRLANMKKSLDPSVIAETSVDLNLKLMKWNLLPTVDLDKLKNTKCLLLGAGTLGCSVARTLIGWGIRHITFVDNANVSFSNPVRQSLFIYQDSVEAKPKSQAAADGLKRIFPGVNSKGFQMTIPMPGHPVGESFTQETVQHIEKLIELIVEHDVVFLLMDSRESRWLPTLLGANHKKLVINAALGFDSYLVMRHGICTEDINIPQLPHPEGFKSIPGNYLGCYFCNDVTAPGDSMKNRTLDQQCTVTRPGVSQIAGALAAELAVAMLQHNEGIMAPAYYTASNQNSNNVNTENFNSSILGVVPHSIRGFLSSLEQFLPATQKYKNCVACSEMIIKEYREKGMEFLFEVFSSSKHLEDVALLTELCKEMNMEDILEFDDEEDFACSSIHSTT
ncbi:unnamed protein product [Diabrotica balteata]|uniref:Ubiquitin-like modifier-activating enzyme ATG7 n=1 Tax=Diabrotica balteata TaxID=107213 RepID=A0A9N9SZ28_DIABA|nr:unnamed protein product [Diabrotica balteata]